ARLAAGPGNLTRALGVTLHDNGAAVTRGPLPSEPPPAARDFRIAVGPRVGITRDIARPLRFWIAGHPAVSRCPQRITQPRASGAGPRGRRPPRRLRARGSAHHRG